MMNVHNRLLKSLCEKENKFEEYRNYVTLIILYVFLTIGVTICPLYHIVFIVINYSEGLLW